jgi:hypothetical protein
MFTLKSIAQTRTQMPVGSLLSRQWSAKLLARDAHMSMDAISPVSCASCGGGRQLVGEQLIETQASHVTCAIAANFKQLTTTGTP